MKYSVLITNEAAFELERAYNWLEEQTQQHAPAWYNGLLAAILSLEEMPSRWPMGRDNDATDRETRQLLYGDKRHGYLVLFEIRDSTVVITHIRHAARGDTED